jgi:hypothetical protein
MLPVLCRIDHADSEKENENGKLLLVVSCQPAQDAFSLGYLLTTMPMMKETRHTPPLTSCWKQARTMRDTIPAATKP